VSVADGIASVRARVAAACARAGRAADDVTLVAVSKTFPADAVSEALAAGVTDVGENRVQEARDKQPAVIGHARWHLIGHLQSNKAKDAVKLFDVIQTVDSVALAEKIARAAGSLGKRQEVLLQVNVGDEPQKSGAAANEVDSIVKAIQPAGTPEESRRSFRVLRALRDGVGVEHLSMGMSEDFEVAIEEGATIIRVGRAIFGSRT
jgi:pyridoxal phosphate enzyme (YggS family)